MKRITSVVAISVAMGFSPQVFAQASHFYAGAEVGYTQLKDVTGDITSIAVGTLGGVASATQDENGYMGRIFAGYNFTENIGLEIAYAQTNTFNLNFNGISRTGIAYSGNGNVNAGGVDYSVLLRPSVSSGWNKLFFRLGGHSLKTETSVSITGGGVSVSSNNDVSGTGWLAGLGYDAEIAKGVDVRFSYTRLERISGQSGSNANILNIGLVKTF